MPLALFLMVAGAAPFLGGASYRRGRAAVTALMVASLLPHTSAQG